ncbi:MAG: hypothetical protein KJ626_12660 [Verrucomicrobia bacterium]|nr:hypothetical protein [Verrucomicrobiota bacterium]
MLGHKGTFRARFERSLDVGSISLIFAAGFLLILACAPAQGKGAYGGDYENKILAKGLSRPDGIAIHPQSGDVYVVEKGAGRVSLVKDGRATPVIGQGWTVANESIPGWAVSRDIPREKWREGKLNEPGAVAVASNGTIYVAEDIPNGRILEFAPGEGGKYVEAKALPIPWLDRPFTWRDIKVTAEGRLLVTGGVDEFEGLHFGTVAMRELDGNWWIVDYGPFVNFAATALSRNEDVILVCDRNKGALAWWDAVRHLPIGDAKQTVDAGSYAAGAALTPDGAFAIGQQSTEGKKNAKVLRVDPLTGQISTLVDSLQSIGSVAGGSRAKSVYVTDTIAGELIESTPAEGLASAPYLIKRSLDGYEMGEGFTPRVAPGFLRNFFSKVGVADQTGGGGRKGEDAVSVRTTMAFSLREFASKIPLVAGQIDAGASLKVSEDITDPIKSIAFVIFFPGKALSGGDMATPSLAYFTAERQSGAKEQTRELFKGFRTVARDKDGDWKSRSSEASLSIPISTCGIEKSEDGMLLNLAFLGLGIYDDYYLRLETGMDNKGEIIVAGKNGGEERYAAVFTRLTETGEQDKNLVVAGFDPAIKGNIGWLNIGKWPVGESMSTSMEQIHGFSSGNAEMEELIKQKDLEWRVELSDSVDDELLESLDSAPPSVEEAGENEPVPLPPAEGDKS